MAGLGRAYNFPIFGTLVELLNLKSFSRLLLVADVLAAKTSLLLCIKKCRYISFFSINITASSVFYLDK